MSIRSLTLRLCCCFIVERLLEYYVLCNLTTFTFTTHYNSNSGFMGAHPDAPEIWMDPYPAVLQRLLRNFVPCYNGTHQVVNAASFGCSPKCHLDRWAENYGTFATNRWDLIIIEPTTNGMHMLNPLKALVAAFLTLPMSSHHPPKFILLSASFVLDVNSRPTSYEDLPAFEHAVSNLAMQWKIPFISFPEYVFSKGLYNGSNHEYHCKEARCTYWLDRVHITKTSHNIIAGLLLSAITTDSAIKSLSLPQTPNITINDAVKRLLPSMPVVWISFRVKELPNVDENLACLEGFHPHNSRDRLSAMYTYGNESTTYRKAHDIKENGASFVLKMPAQCKRDFQIQVEFLNSHTTGGVLTLTSYSKEVEIMHNATALCIEKTENLTVIGTFNSSNNEEISVSKSVQYRLEQNVFVVQGTVHGGDFHLLSLGIYCL